MPLSAKSAKAVPVKAVTLADCSLGFWLPKWHIFIGRVMLRCGIAGLPIYL